MNLRSAALFPALAASVAAGQEPRAAISGQVLDRTTRTALSGARVQVLSNGHAAITDSLGMYRFTDLPPGVTELLVTAFAFPQTHVVVELEPGREMAWPIAMDSTAAGQKVQQLPAVDVAAEARLGNYRLVDFERRRKTGRGRYMTETEIVNSGAYNVPDVVKNMAGVLYECNSEGCWVRFTRAPARCRPQYIVDDHVMNDWGLLTPIRDIVAMEVYTGPSDVPGEYSGSNAACGVIVIWTRAGPTPRVRRKP